MTGPHRLVQLGSDPDSPFPPLSRALKQPNGLLAWGGDLQPRRLLNAYRRGIFPWYSEGEPILWWSPAPRCALFPDRVYLSRRLRRRFNSGQYEIRADSQFEQVIKACAEPRPGEPGTWITAEMIDAYCRLHELGHAHTVEVWQQDRLVGGIYGIALGSVFFGESMFSRVSDGSKLALVALCRQLQAWGYGLLDCQVGNPHLYRMGAENITRPAFETWLRKLQAEERAPANWRDSFSAGKRW